MQSSYQSTLKNEVRLIGVGLHSGKPVQVILRPAAPNHGIRFVRTDLEGSPQIPANHRHVISTQLATTLGLEKNPKVTISTVEHLLAALQGLGIDNVLVLVDGPEIPILDGSAGPFCRAIHEAGGVQTQAQNRVFLALRRKVEIKVGEKWAVAEPAARLEIFGSIEWDHPSIGYQEYHYIQGKTDFAEVAGARTFCMLKDVEMMRRQGLARGGSLANAVVLDDALVLNPEGLRYPDEFIRHKVLDALGDFKLAGIEMQGYFRLHRAGHDLHAQLLQAIFKDPLNYEIVDNSTRDEQWSAMGRIRSAISRVAALG